MRLAKLTEFRALVFTPGSAPALATLRGRINDGKIPGGACLDGRYYVDLDEFDRSTNLRQGLAAKRAELASNPLLRGLV